MLEDYKKKICVGQIVRARVESTNPDNAKTMVVKAAILELYKHVAKIGYWGKVPGMDRMVYRYEFVQIKDLMLQEFADAQKHLKMAKTGPV